MTASRGAALYTPEILSLAVELADYPLTPDLVHRGEAVSRVCGSRMIIGLFTTTSGQIAKIGAQVTACAIGQAAAALFLRTAPGKSCTDLARARAELETWLARGAPLPSWNGIDTLEPARAYPARHAAILLPWSAAIDALSNTLRAD